MHGEAIRVEVIDEPEVDVEGLVHPREPTDDGTACAFGAMDAADNENPSRVRVAAFEDADRASLP